jgi:hypothetical protein
MVINGNETGDFELKNGGGNVTWQRTFLLKIFYAQMIKKFAEVIPHFIESYKAAKKVP